MSHVQKQPCRHRPAHAARPREGAVMLVVLLILMVATASAAVSVSTVQLDLQAAGNDRVATQGQYVADTALATSIAWIAKLQRGDLPLTVVQPDASPPINPIDTEGCTERSVEKGNLAAQVNMTYQLAQYSQLSNATNEVAPLNSAASAGSGGSGGTGGSGGSAAPVTPDTLGSFGPNQGNEVPQDGYVIHLTDCMQLAGAMVAGENYSQSSGHSLQPPLACVLTAYGRIQPVGLPTTKTTWWTTTGTQPDTCYRLKKWTSVHNARAQIVIPPS